MLTKGELQMIFLHEYKLGRNAAQAYCNVVLRLGEEAIPQCAYQWCAKFQSSDKNKSLREEKGQG